MDSLGVKVILDLFPQQCEEASHIGNRIKVELPINAIVFCGVGASGLPGEIIKTVTQVTVPIITVKDYTLPKFADHNTLVFAISYNGNNEETISCYREALKRKCKLISITSGGKLKHLSIQNKTTVITVPKELQTRHSIGYQTLPILNVLYTSKMIQDPKKDIESAIAALRKDHQKQAKELAAKLYGKLPVVYASSSVSAIAMVWKVLFNENPKIPAFCNVYPEWNHYELVGYTHQSSSFYAILIEDQSDSPKMQNRFAATKTLLQKQGIPVLQLKLSGNTLLTRLFSAIYLGCYVSYFLAEATGVDPGVTPLADELKRMLNQN